MGGGGGLLFTFEKPRTKQTTTVTSIFFLYGALFNRTWYTLCMYITCISTQYCTCIYDLLHKLSIANKYMCWFLLRQKCAHVAYDLWDALVTVCVVLVLLKFEELYYTSYD